MLRLAGINFLVGEKKRNMININPKQPQTPIRTPHRDVMVSKLNL